MATRVSFVSFQCVCRNCGKEEAKIFCPVNTLPAIIGGTAAVTPDGWTHDGYCDICKLVVADALAKVRNGRVVRDGE